MPKPSNRKLKNETEFTPEMQERILDAYGAWSGEDAYATAQADFEHGQWWITVLDSGRQFSVCDAIGGDSVDGFCFEEVSQGDEIEACTVRMILTGSCARWRQPMKFKLEIEIGTEDMRTYAEISHTLEAALIDKLNGVYGPPFVGDEGVIRDTNSHVVGRWTVTRK